jgi:endoglucanase
MRRARTTAILAVLVVAVPLGGSASSGAIDRQTALSTRQQLAPAPAKVRVDQLGYLPRELKRARLMTSRPIDHATYTVVDRDGDPVLHGRVPDQPAGSWNRHYRAVYLLSFSRLTTPGTYRVAVSGDVTAASPRFRIGAASALYGKLLRYGVRFDQVQRDGRAVIPGPLHRKPAHLHDRRALVYARPSFVPGSDTVTDPDLRRIGGPVDVAGGWYDAGDYLKFTHSTAYNDVLLWTSAQLVHGRSRHALLAEARHGLAWLGRMWDARTKTLYMQVGIGSGNRRGTFHGDHDLWRLPQRDDHNTRHLDRYVSHRPVFLAAPPGALISPNLVGRVSAAFALAAQADAATHPARARRELRQATLLYARARTSHPPHQLVTALPHAFYPEDSWHDDMELGAAEIALATRLLRGQARPYVVDASRWARGYLRTEAGDSLNLYDTSALAHVALVEAIHRTHVSRGLAVRRAGLVRDLRHQLGRARHRAQHDAFGAGGFYDEFDVNSHTFGLIATAGLYHRLTHRTGYDGFATSQRNWLLGENPWGVAAMVGIGTRFPRCMQHQIANLRGTTDGSAPVDVGAVVNGPNGAGIFAGGLGGYQDGMVRCPPGGADPFVRFNGRGSRYVDDVRSWQTDEPALDMTGAAIIAAAAQQGIRH